jgi:hypothetical protein
MSHKDQEGAPDFTQRATVREAHEARTDLAYKRKRTPSAGRMASPKMRARQMDPERNQAFIAARQARLEAIRRGEITPPKRSPDGWGSASRQHLRRYTIRMAEKRAEEALVALIEQGIVNKDAAGNAILKWAIGVVLSKTEEGESCYPIREQLQAAKIVMEYTTAKPASTVKAEVGAEGFLESLLTKK